MTHIKSIRRRTGGFKILGHRRFSSKKLEKIKNKILEVESKEEIIENIEYDLVFYILVLADFEKAPGSIGISLCNKDDDLCYLLWTEENGYIYEYKTFEFGEEIQAIQEFEQLMLKETRSTFAL